MEKAQSIRRISSKEEQLLEILIGLANIQLDKNWKTHLLVKPMNDGGMQSLKLYPNGLIENSVRFGKMVSECTFFDEDNVLVIVSLNIDNHGQLYELDSWKTDFSSIVNLVL